ncbi:MAG: carbohydrate ABC transporter permease [Oribacterium sp.]|nr:carbohydrate ABC transporter permease [Oribacterium sp.]
MRAEKEKGKSGQIYSTNSRVIRGIISALFILYTMIAFFVLGVTLMNSFKGKSELSKNLFSLPRKFTLENYRTLFAKDNIIAAFGNSFLFVICGTVLCIFLATMVAYGISRYEFKGKGYLTAYFLVGMMVPMQVTVLPLFLILQKMHLLNTRIGMILLYGSGISLSMYVFSKFFRTIPKALEESAKLDGASDFITFILIILPVSKPVVFTMSLLSAVGIWNDFYMPMVLLSKKSKQTLTLLIYTYMSQFIRKMDIAFAAVVITLIPMIILYCLFSTQMVQGITGGSVKG